MAEDFDVSEFYDIFFEECLENLEVLEGGLLALAESGDVDGVNTIFRAAHSIKGGAATFGLAQVADYTHAMESLLGVIRDGKLEAEQEVVDLLLESNDFLRNMLGNQGIHGEEAQYAELIARMTAAKGNEQFSIADSVSKTEDKPAKEETGLVVSAVYDAPPSPEVVEPEAVDVPVNKPLAKLENSSASAAASTEEAVKVDSKADASKNNSNSESSTIRVRTEKVDELINLVGELVITQSMLSQMSNAFGEQLEPAMRSTIEQLSRNTREIQESVMQVRMLPMSVAFSRFPRLVRDFSRKLGKEVDLHMSGETTELDKTVLQAIGDPLVHLVRNALDHGIEAPDVREELGKPRIGNISLSAMYKGASVAIEIRDDGGGINGDKLLKKAREKGILSPEAELDVTEALDLIFHPGFSTAEVVSDVSGRGVGMDVVRNNILF